MAFADDLLEQARHLARREKKYYALFHLLIEETVANWKRSEQRHRLARAFEHHKMKKASEKATKSASFPGANPLAVADLQAVAIAFIQLQQHRHSADYDNSVSWSRTQALAQIDLAGEAFRSWRGVRNEKIAHEYLLWFLVDRP
jgi:hypothetical protein